MVAVFCVYLVAVSSLEGHCINQDQAQKPLRFTKALEFYKSKQKLCIVCHVYTSKEKKYKCIFKRCSKKQE